MRLGDHVELGFGISGKVIGRTFEEEMRLDLQTPWGVLNGVRLAAIDEGSVFESEWEGAAPKRSSRDDGTIDLETPWGRLNAVPMNVLQRSFGSQGPVAVSAHRPAKTLGKVVATPAASVADKVKEIGRTAAAKRTTGLEASGLESKTREQATLDGEAGPSTVSLGRWPKGKRPNGGTPSRVA